MRSNETKTWWRVLKVQFVGSVRIVTHPLMKQERELLNEMFDPFVETVNFYTKKGRLWVKYWLRNHDRTYQAFHEVSNQIAEIAQWEQVAVAFGDIKGIRNFKGVRRKLKSGDALRKDARQRLNRWLFRKPTFFKYKVAGLRFTILSLTNFRNYNFFRYTRVAKDRINKPINAKAGDSSLACDRGLARTWLRVGQRAPPLTAGRCSPCWSDPWSLGSHQKNQKNYP